MQPVPTTAQPRLEPVSPERRVVTIDVLRGVALLGILLMNILYFFSGLMYPLEGFSLTPLGDGVRAMTDLLVTGSFYPIFSFLFGLGFALQLERGEAAPPRFRRRLLFLLLIGLLHGFLVWLGDILTTYAAVGFLLPLFRKRSDRTLLVWIAVGTLFTALLSALPYLLGVGEQGGGAVGGTPQGVAFSEGSLAEVLLVNAQTFAFRLPIVVFAAPQILSLFLVGLLVGRRGILQDAPSHQPFLRRAFWASLLVALPTVALHTLALAGPTWWVGLLSTLDLAVGSPALGFAYLAGLALLLTRAPWSRRLEPLAATGRMALTNYLMQSLLLSLLFYGYGLGLYGTLRSGEWVGVALALFGAQVLFSRLWLSRFRYGPAEWVWRSLTYGAGQPLRRPA